MTDNVQIITEPYDYLISHPGKDIRKQLLAACSFWLQIDDSALAVIGSSISMLHNASLLYVFKKLSDNKERTLSLGKDR